MPDDPTPRGWQLLALPLIPAAGAGLGFVLNRIKRRRTVDPARLGLAARLIAHQIASEAGPG